MAFTRDSFNYRHNRVKLSSEIDNFDSYSDVFSTLTVVQDKDKKTQKSILLLKLKVYQFLSKDAHKTNTVTVLPCVKMKWVTSHRQNFS